MSHFDILKESEKKKEPGEIDFVRLFEAEVIELLAAVKRGKVLHKTKNIRESGAPFEAGFRELLRSKLPSTYRVLTGYFLHSMRTRVARRRSMR